MPLQLFNAGPYPIRITPYVSICQLMLVRLSSTSEHPYGSEKLQSKYVNDDGGPSFWWRDRQITALQARLGEINVTGRIERDIIERVRFESPEILDRFQRFVQSRRVHSVENAAEVLDSFAEREAWRQRVDHFSMALVPVMASGTVGSLFVRPIGVWHVLVWVLTAIALVAGAHALARREGGYLTTAALRQVSKA